MADCDDLQLTPASTADDDENVDSLDIDDQQQAIDLGFSAAVLQRRLRCVAFADEGDGAAGGGGGGVVEDEEDDDDEDDDDDQTVVNRQCQPRLSLPFDRLLELSDSAAPTGLIGVCAACKRQTILGEAETDRADRETSLSEATVTDVPGFHPVQPGIPNCKAAAAAAATAAAAAAADSNTFSSSSTTGCTCGSNSINVFQQLRQNSDRIRRRQSSQSNNRAFPASDESDLQLSRSSRRRRQRQAKFEMKESTKHYRLPFKLCLLTKLKTNLPRLKSIVTKTQCSIRFRDSLLLKKIGGSGAYLKYILFTLEASTAQQLQRCLKLLEIFDPVFQTRQPCSDLPSPVLRWNKRVPENTELCFFNQRINGQSSLFGKLPVGQETVRISIPNFQRKTSQKTRFPKDFGISTYTEASNARK